jgi:two-component system OmpR family response regulator/two-component system response regulator RstA
MTAGSASLGADEPPVIAELQRDLVLVESDPRVAGSVTEFLRSHGFKVHVEGRGEAATAAILARQPALVMLNLTLPGMSGLEVARSVRPHYFNPFVVITESEGEMARVSAGGAWADDFVTKPINLFALLASIRALLRRTAVEAERRPVVLGDLMVDTTHRVATLRNERLNLTTAEFDLLAYLCRNPGRTIDRNLLHLKLRGQPYDGLDRSIDLRVSRLRNKLRTLDAMPIRIEAVRGVGYVLQHAYEASA